MVKIRLERTGRKHYATYKIVITDSRKPRTSKFIEYVGNYNPHTKDLVLQEDRIKYWISVGAQPTDTVRRMLEKKNILEKLKFKKTFNKKPGKKAVERADKKSSPKPKAEKKVEAETEKSE